MNDMQDRNILQEPHKSTRQINMFLFEPFFFFFFLEFSGLSLLGSVCTTCLQYLYIYIFFSFAFKKPGHPYYYVALPLGQYTLSRTSTILLTKVVKASKMILLIKINQGFLLWSNK